VTVPGFPGFPGFLGRAKSKRRVSYLGGAALAVLVGYWVLTAPFGYSRAGIRDVAHLTQLPVPPSAELEGACLQRRPTQVLWARLTVDRDSLASILETVSRGDEFNTSTTERHGITSDRMPPCLLARRWWQPDSVSSFVSVQAKRYAEPGPPAGYVSLLADTSDTGDRVTVYLVWVRI